MKILLIGEIGVGKTRVCEKIVEGARRKGIACTGTLTRNFEEKGNVVLQIEELSSGEKRILAQKKDDGKVPKGIHICKYVFNEDTVKFAKKAFLKRGDLLVIDEVGPLELAGKAFSNAFKEFERTGNHHALLVTRIEIKDEVAKRLKTNYETYEVTEKNRNKLPEIILSRLINQRALCVQPGDDYGVKNMSPKKIYVKNFEKIDVKVTLSDDEVRVWVTKDGITMFRLKTKGKVNVSTPKILTGVIDVTVE